MSEPKLSEGWEVYHSTSPFIDINNGYEYLTIRRKKLEPMPEIEVGDVIHYDGQFRPVVAVEEDGYIKYLDPDLVRNGYYLRCFVNHPGAKVYRDGKVIWERKP